MQMTESEIKVSYQQAKSKKEQLKILAELNVCTKGGDTMPKKYRLYDLYECYGKVAESDDLYDVIQAAEKWEEETDGECDLIFQEWSDIYQTYICHYEQKKGV